MKLIKKTLYVLFTIIALNCITSTPVKATDSESIRGMWLSYVDQQDYLKGKTQKEYDETFAHICKIATEKGLNTIFVHVRSHNDAIYPSNIYPWSTIMLNGDPGFDPLHDMIEIAHKHKLKIHAWINPYGYRKGIICGDSTLATNENIEAGVKEILDNYDVDGIHYDDYFPPFGEDYIDQIIIKTHAVCYEHNKIFGIAPQGNIQNCIAAGANVTKWLSSKEYIDYIAPQIYWTDNYGKDGNIPMSSDRIKAWNDINTADIPMYIGMALYRAGNANTSDAGWVLKTNNLETQYKYAKKLGYGGYILYSTKSVLEPNAVQQDEILNLINGGN